MKQLSFDLPLPEGYAWIFRASFTTPTGYTIYAKNYGLKAFRFPVKVEPDDNKESGTT